MPFADSFNSVFSDIVQPAFLNYEVTRADTRLDERNILAKIMSGIDEADLIIADITKTNANVMYELGVAHALGKPTIMIAEDVETLPFDIRSYPVHEYGSARSQGPRLSALLRETGERHLEGGIRFGNPVADFVRRVATARSEAKPNPTYTPEAAVTDMTWAAEHIEHFFKRFDDISQDHTGRLAVALPKLRQRSSAEEYSASVREIADSTREFALETETLSDEFHEVWRHWVRAMQWFLSPEVLPQVGNERVLQHVERARATNSQLNDLLTDLADLRHAQATFPDSMGGNLSHALEVSRTAISNLLNEIMSAKAYLAWVIDHHP
ncbi:MAG TPA: nucleoside 2-deoxyribosyltransferase [Thermoanaerobaculia bacterium]|jgi:hypothetical protein|nr:nucleoside 2-deoxyribosyltransferase [Thermoanaerobaculia bacterium]